MRLVEIIKGKNASPQPNTDVKTIEINFKFKHGKLYTIRGRLRPRPHEDDCKRKR